MVASGLLGRPGRPEAVTAGMLCLVSPAARSCFGSLREKRTVGGKGRERGLCMLLRTKFHGKTYEFPDLRILMGKANEEKSGDRLARCSRRDRRRARRCQVRPG